MVGGQWSIFSKLRKIQYFLPFTVTIVSEYGEVTVTSAVTYVNTVEPKPLKVKCPPVGESGMPYSCSFAAGFGSSVEATVSYAGSAQTINTPGAWICSHRNQKTISNL